MVRVWCLSDPASSTSIISASRFDHDRTRRHARAQHRSTRRRRTRALLAIVGVAALAGALVGAGQATGIVAVDVAYRAIFAAAISWATAHARRWSWAAAAGLAGAAGAGAVVAFVPAAIALALSWWAISSRRSERWLGACVGGLVACSLLTLPGLVAFGVPSAIAGLVALVVLASGVPNMKHARRLRAWALGLTLVATFASVGATWSTLSVADTTRVATADALDGLRALSAGDDAAAVRSFAAAERGYADVRATLDAPWAMPARLVPVVAQNLDAVQTLARQGERLAAEAQGASSVLSTRQYLDGEGNFDLSVLRDLEPEAERIADLLAEALDDLTDVTTPWVLPPARERLDLATDELAATLPTVDLVAAGLEAAPSILGADRPRAYLVVVANPSESRELGGLASGFGLLRADGGELTYDQSESRLDVRNLLRIVRPELSERTPPGLAAAEPVRFPQNWTSSPNLDAVLDLASELWASVQPEQQIDGILYADPYAVAQLLRFSGAVQLPDQGITLKHGNAVEFLLRDQYRSFGDLNDERDDALEDLADEVFDRLTDELPDPRTFAERMAPLVDGRHLLFLTHDDATRAVLDSSGLSGSFDPELGDLVVTTANTRANKMDAYLRRQVSLDVVVGEDSTSAEVTVRLTNDVPDGLGQYVTGTGDVPDGLPELTNRTLLAVHAPWRDVAVTVDGVAVGAGSDRSSSSTYRHALAVEIDQGQTVEVTFTLTNPLDPTTEILRVLPTPSAIPGRFEAAVDSSVDTLVAEQRHDAPVLLPLE